MEIQGVGPMAVKLDPRGSSGDTCKLVAESPSNWKNDTEETLDPPSTVTFRIPAGNGVCIRSVRRNPIVPNTGIVGVIACPTSVPLVSNTRTVKAVAARDWLQIAKEIL
jgi:hypothetical protein